MTLEDLQGRLEDATRGLDGVTSKRAFASPGFFAGGAMFAFAWRSALRIVVKLPDEASRASLLGIEGAAPWTPSGKRMGAWVMLPEAWHDDLPALRPWVRRAYEQVLRAAEDEVPSMAGRVPAKLRAAESKKTQPAAIETLHDGATRARRVEKPGTRTAAAPAPRRAAKKKAAKKSAAKKSAAKKMPAKNATKKT